ncbi:hypothetical protein O181_123100 [Austropuccinia psidii MF-1]|uniref:Uncharacterized protein n=1 Tax=Austropuccinia psidii MF-1 TaxID=1389203 RepID=A0A9Q3Q3W8_9BASI|nr:hypothetical protein [Austropuccinia psidii MF-1]
MYHFQLVSHPSRIEPLQYLVDITLELDTRYHERKNQKSHHQEKKLEASKSNYSHTQNSSSSSQKKKKRDKPHFSFVKKDFKLMKYEKEGRIKGALYTYCDGNHSLESYFKGPQNQLAQPSAKFTSQGKA